MSPIKHAPRRSKTIVTRSASPALLGPEDPPPVRITGAGADSPFLIVGDHAGRSIPARLGRLGLGADALERHIAWDIGVAGLAARLGEALGACVITQAYSRLVIDCNRAPAHPQSIVTVSDETAIPGNVGLSQTDAAERAAAIQKPYQDAIAAEIAARRARGLATVLVCQHSFTPAMGGRARPWSFGILHLGDSAISLALLALLREETGLLVGDNEPYAMDGTDYTAPLHAAAADVEAVEIEVRQDLVADAAGQAAVADLLARLLPLAHARTLAARA